MERSNEWTGNTWRVRCYSPALFSSSRSARWRVLGSHVVDGVPPPVIPTEALVDLRGPVEIPGRDILGPAVGMGDLVKEQILVESEGLLTACPLRRLGRSR